MLAQPAAAASAASSAATAMPARQACPKAPATAGSAGSPGGGDGASRGTAQRGAGIRRDFCLMSCQLPRYWVYAEALAMLSEVSSLRVSEPYESGTPGPLLPKDRALFFADPGLLLVGAKPADDGEGAVLRLLDVARNSRPASVWPAAFRYTQARRVNLVEMNEAPLNVAADGRVSRISSPVRRCCRS